MLNKIANAIEEFFEEPKREEKKEFPLKARLEQKQHLERLSKLLGYEPIKTRKLTLEFQNKKKPKIIIQTPRITPEQEQQENYQEIKQEIKEETKEEIKINSKQTTQIQEHITLKEITQYFKNEGVVGEEKLCLKTYLAGANNLSFGVEGYSGSGKTYIVDKLIKLYNENEIYKLDLSSKMGIFYDQTINNYKTIYIPELQKALQERGTPIIEVVKNLTEGKSVKRIVTNTKRKGSKTYNIQEGKSIIYTLASENHYKKDEELNRRFLRFHTDNTQEHIDKILNHKSQRRQKIQNTQQTNIETKVKNHFNNLRELNINIFDPYSTNILEYLPRTQKTIGYIDHYFNLIDSITKFHHEQRNKFQIKNQTYIITNIEDHQIIHAIYYQEFLETLKGFSKRNNLEEEIQEIKKLEKKQINWEEIQTKTLEHKKTQELRFLHPWINEEKQKQIKEYNFTEEYSK